MVSASFDGPKLTLLYRSGLLVQKDRNSPLVRVYPLQIAFVIPSILLALGSLAGLSGLHSYHVRRKNRS